MANQNSSGLIVLSSILGVTVIGGIIYLFMKGNTAAAATAKPLSATPRVPIAPSNANTAATNAANAAAIQQAGSTVGSLISNLFKSSGSSSNGSAQAPIVDYSPTDYYGGYTPVVSVTPDASLTTVPDAPTSLPTGISPSLSMGDLTPATNPDTLNGFDGAGTKHFDGFIGAGTLFK